MPLDPTQRFSQRVAYYVLSRPGYPTALIDFFRSDLSLGSSHTIADIGSGTGLLSTLFLANGNPVIGVEPNDDMRAAGESLLSTQANFTSVNASAEKSTLADASVDFVIAGQAFHWFEPRQFSLECRRILRRGGWAALIWNERRAVLDGFNLAYDSFIHEFTSEPAVAEIRGGSIGADSAVATFFDSNGFQTKSFPNHQDLDWEGLKARVYSSSYMPMPDDPRAPAMLGSLLRIYDAFRTGAFIRLDYETRVFYGQFGLP